MNSKRIGYEIMELVNYCGPVTVETDNDDHSSSSRYTIRMSLKDLNIRFILDNRYPFSPPRSVFVNDKDYIRVVGQSITRFSQIGVEQHFPICFCCESLICPDRWVPTTGMVKLCGEIKSVIEKKKLIMHIWFCRQVASEKLTYDIPLEHYL